LKVILVVGTRPQIIKSAPIVRRVNDYTNIDLKIVHTGQHYHKLMSDVFFKELDFPEPIINLGVGSGSHAYQIGEIIIRLTKFLEKQTPDVVLVPGDTNSALATALASSKLNIPIAHIEAGARCYDMSMPEEVNRRLIDHSSKFLFAPSPNCVKNLMKEGLTGILSGDTMYEVLSRLITSAPVVKSNFVLVTLHRPRNVDNKERLGEIVDELCKIGDEMPVIFPIHPRTERRLFQFDLYGKLERKVDILKPLSYLRMLQFVRSAKVVITDSGGLQKEAFWLGKPTITVRPVTEWIETIELGLNRLSEPHEIYEKFCFINEKSSNFVSPEANPFLTDDLPSKKIIDVLTSYQDEWKQQF